MAIKEDYVSFEVAKLLKEKGFKGQGEHFYENNKIIGYINYWDRITPKQRYEAIEAPTLQMAMKWLREEHNIDILITIGGFIKKGKVYFCSVYKNLINYGDLKECSTYEEACEAGIKHCLNNII